MTKSELMKEYNRLSEEKGVHLDGINCNCNKSQIENAIECLKCSDETLDEYLTVIKLKYPNTYNTIKNNGNYKHHSYNRLYVFNTARMILA
jgi:hypothetical protein